LQDECVVFGQRQRIGGQLIQGRIFQLQGRLNIPAGLLLTKDVGNVVRTKGAGGAGLLEGGYDGVRTP
jgi:hypothetical protein